MDELDGYQPLFSQDAISFPEARYATEDRFARMTQLRSAAGWT
jgi:hypothetical protein